MECRVVSQVEVGDKILFVGEVVEAYADEALVLGKGEVDYASGEFPRPIYGTRFRDP
jgi:flavin reductase (DIM6/NTAB) family NADH-FMN oxidoreductase RutF